MILSKRDRNATTDVARGELDRAGVADGYGHSYARLNIARQLPKAPRQLRRTGAEALRPWVAQKNTGVHEAERAV
jgi:hypothetical protein